MKVGKPKICVIIVVNYSEIYNITFFFSQQKIKKLLNFIALHWINSRS